MSFPFTHNISSHLLALLYLYDYSICYSVHFCCVCGYWLVWTLFWGMFLFYFINHWSLDFPLQKTQFTLSLLAHYHVAFHCLRGFLLDDDDDDSLRKFSTFSSLWISLVVQVRLCSFVLFIPFPFLYYEQQLTTLLWVSLNGG